MQALNAGKVKGFDVSHHNGHVDFARAKAAGFSFVYVKATEGSGYVDPMFISNVKAAKAAGLHVGAYHFARPGDGTHDAIAEAKHFVDVLKQADTDLLPVLDLEVSMLNAQQTTEWALSFVDYVQKETGRKVMLYTGVAFAQEHGGFMKKLAHLPLWVAYYRETPPPAFGGWTAWTVWQYTETGSVPGVNGHCDVDVAVDLAAILAKPQTQIAVHKETKSTATPKPAAKPAPAPKAESKPAQKPEQKAAPAPAQKPQPEAKPAPQPAQHVAPAGPVMHTQPAPQKPAQVAPHKPEQPPPAVKQPAKAAPAKPAAQKHAQLAAKKAAYQARMKNWVRHFLRFISNRKG